MQYAEYDNINRERISFENKETSENDLDDFAQLNINGLDEVVNHYRNCL